MPAISYLHPSRVTLKHFCLICTMPWSLTYPKDKPGGQPCSSLLLRGQKAMQSKSQATKSKWLPLPTLQLFAEFSHSPRRFMLNWPSQSLGRGLLVPLTSSS